MENQKYYHKYLKYKTKYLRKKSGGGKRLLPENARKERMRETTVDSIVDMDSMIPVMTQIFNKMTKIPFSVFELIHHQIDNIAAGLIEWTDTEFDIDGITYVKGKELTQFVNFLQEMKTKMCDSDKQMRDIFKKLISVVKFNYIFSKLYFDQEENRYLEIDFNDAKFYTRYISMSSDMVINSEFLRGICGKLRADIIGIHDDVVKETVNEQCDALMNAIIMLESFGLKKREK